MKKKELRKDLVKRRVESIKAKIELECPVATKRPLATFAAVCEKKDMVYANHICFAPLSRMKREVYGDLWLIIVRMWSKGYILDNLPLKDYTRYTRWLRNDSPYAPVFVQKGAVRPGKYYHLRCNWNSKLTIAAMVAMRQVTEYPLTVQFWNKLVDHGVDPFFAYLVMPAYGAFIRHTVCRDGVEYFIPTIRKAGGSNHQPINPEWVTKRALEEMQLLGKTDPLNKKGGYDGVQNHIHSQNAGWSLVKTIDNAMVKACDYTEPEVVDVWGFKRKEVRLISEQKAIEVIKTITDKWKKELDL